MVLMATISACLTSTNEFIVPAALREEGPTLLYLPFSDGKLRHRGLKVKSEILGPGFLEVLMFKAEVPGALGTPRLKASVQK